MEVPNCFSPRVGFWKPCCHAHKAEIDTAHRKDFVKTKSINRHEFDFNEICFTIQHSIWT